MLLDVGSAHVSIWQAICLGVLQGATEFLPVSSTAHMAIVPQLFGFQDPGASFSAVVQLGPITAITYFFRHEIVRYWRGIIRSRSPFKIAAEDLDARLGWYTLLGTLPLAVMGLLLERAINKEFRRLDVIAVALIVFGLLMLVADRYGKCSRKIDDVNIWDCQAVGWAQVAALIPGASRSGVTISAGLLRGMDYESAVKFSFLLSIPAIALSGTYKFVKVVVSTRLGTDTGTYVLATLVAAVAAYYGITWFVSVFRSYTAKLFILYRIVLGAGVLVLLHVGLLRQVGPRPVVGATIVEKAACIGFVQGVTELLPVSSSGHAVILQHRLGWHDGSLEADVVYHVGTIVVVSLAVWRLIAHVLRGCRKKLLDIWFGRALHAARADPTTGSALAARLGISLATTGLVGLPFRKAATLQFLSPSHASINLLITGLILWFTQQFAANQPNYWSRAARTDNAGGADVPAITAFQAAVIGVAQGLAVFPGISRFGATLAAALVSGVPRKHAINYSLLLSIPTVVCVALLERNSISRAIRLGLLPLHAAGTGMCFAAIGATIAIKVLQMMSVPSAQQRADTIVQRGGVPQGRVNFARATIDLAAFAIWCWVVGSISLAYFAKHGG